jgi:hypothetical protein
MNDRIKELWDDAGKATQDNSWDSQTEFINRFAESIIQECIRLAKETPCPYDNHNAKLYGHTWDMACIESGNYIREKFGLK